MIFILEDNDERIENFKMVLGTIESHVEKTVPDAIEWLTSNCNRASIFSLDNDLYVPEYEGEEGEGWQLCEWLISNVDKRPLLIHTTNIIAADKMEMLCSSAGWKCMKIAPYNGCEWIHKSWIKAIETSRSQ